MNFLSLVSTIVILLFTTSTTTSIKVGINYGQLGDNLPSASRSVELIKSVGAGNVKLYDTNPGILSALANTGLDVSVMVPNGLIVPIASNQSQADLWVRSNVHPFVPATRIRYLLVGNEILSDRSIEDSVWPCLVPAMVNIKRSLLTSGLSNIMVGTPLAMDVLETSYPPSLGAFRPDIARNIILPLLQFLQLTRSSFFLDVYPYFVWASSPRLVNLKYALLDPTAPSYTDQFTRLVYTNMLDQQLDAVAFAMARLGYSRVGIVVAETGWPNAGNQKDIGAKIQNAMTYNRNLVRRLARGFGTPLRPSVKILTFVFSLYDENLKGGEDVEKHWGLFYPNATAVYAVDLSGRRIDY